MECSKKTRAKAKAELRNIPCKKNSISVELQPINSSVSNLALVYKKQKVEVINFPKTKRFIRFSFPEGYSEFDIRVFEENESEIKTTIMNAYEANNSEGFSLFDSQWGGDASSGQHQRQFVKAGSDASTLFVLNKNKDGTQQGTEHTYILSFKWQNDRYLLDPKIRNRGR
jgi:hypothetical protein